MKVWLIAIACFIAGYWLVAQLFDRRQSNDAPRKDPAPEADAARAMSDERVTLSNWFRILDVRENATREEIAAAYKRKIAQYHPDKVAQLGPEIRAVAETKSKQINAAYDMGLRLFR